MAAGDGLVMMSRQMQRFAAESDNKAGRAHAMSSRANTASRWAMETGTADRHLKAAMMHDDASDLHYKAANAVSSKGEARAHAKLGKKHNRMMLKHLEAGNLSMEDMPSFSAESDNKAGRAHAMSSRANTASRRAMETGTADRHLKAAMMHDDASDLHYKAANAVSSKGEARAHAKLGKEHNRMMLKHLEAGNLSMEDMPSFSASKGSHFAASQRDQIFVEDPTKADKVSALIEKLQDGPSWEQHHDKLHSYHVHASYLHDKAAKKYPRTHPEHKRHREASRFHDKEAEEFDFAAFNPGGPKKGAKRWYPQPLSMPRGTKYSPLSIKAIRATHLMAKNDWNNRHGQSISSNLKAEKLHLAAGKEYPAGHHMCIYHAALAKTHGNTAMDLQREEDWADRQR